MCASVKQPFGALAGFHPSSAISLLLRRGVFLGGGGVDIAHNRQEKKKREGKKASRDGRNLRSFRLLIVQTPDLKQIVTNKGKEFIISSVGEGGS